MIPAPRRWFSFSLRTMFVVVRVFACWLGYELNWIRQRHEALDKDGFTSEAPPASADFVTAPGWLWLFGERGYDTIWFKVPNDERDGMELNPAEVAEVARVSRLFPEAEIGEWWEYGHVAPTTLPGTISVESERNPAEGLDPFKRGPFKGDIDLIR